MNPNRLIVQSFRSIRFDGLTKKQKRKLRKKGIKITTPKTWLTPMPARSRFTSKLEQFQNAHQSSIETSGKTPTAVIVDDKTRQQALATKQCELVRDSKSVESAQSNDSNIRGSSDYLRPNQTVDTSIQDTSSHCAARLPNPPNLLPSACGIAT